MDWKNLKENRCPSCAQDFKKTLCGGRDGEMNCTCGFTITIREYQRRASEQIKRAVDAADDERNEWRFNR